MPRLLHTGFTVSSLERSLRSYVDVLGMSVVMAQEKQGGYLAKITGYPDAHVSMAQLEFSPGEHRLELFQYVAPLGNADRPEPCKVGITHVCLLVDDLEAIYRRFRSDDVASGATFISVLTLIDTGANAGGAGLYLRDPDGIVLKLFQRPGAAATASAEGSG